MTTITLKQGEGRLLRDGGLWIFDNEISKIDGSYNNGDIVKVISFNDHFLGYGYINDNSKIRIRILSRNEDEVIDNQFFYNRLLKAYEYRKDVINLDSCRLVFSDADLLPGLVIDKFEDILVLEADTLGIDIRKKELALMMMDILKKDNINIKGVYERSDAKTRTLEGLERVKGFLVNEFETLIHVNENGVKLIVDIAEGQKTGYFLDQKYNHLAIRDICKDKKVLDCFTHTGGFALSAAKVAKEVIGVDASELAINQARENAKLNNFNNIKFEVADVFDYLPYLLDKKEQFDVVVLDPPAFTKTKSSLKNATKGYKEINMNGMHLVKDGGYLVTCSCSEYMDMELFKNTILSAANDAHKRLKLVEERRQGRDHPILVSKVNREYLKCLIYQVNNR